MQDYKYKISLKKFITDLDKKVLINLYQPILGAKATSIYLTLIEEKELLNKLPNIDFDSSRLHSILNISSEKLENHLRKLEGMKLIKRTFNKNQNRITFNILTPLEPEDFFENIIFDEALQHKIGDENYEIIRFFYKEDKDYVEESDEDLTWTFERAFPNEIKTIEENTLKNNSNKKEKNIDCNNQELIDFSNLEIKLIENGISVDSLNDNIKKIILNNIIECDLDSDGIVELIKESYNYDKKVIDKTTFKIKMKKAVILHKKKTKKSEKEVIVEEMDALSPEVYFESLTEKQVGIDVQNIINNLKNKYELKNGTVNCLMYFSYLKNEGKVIGNYLYKIAESLNKKRITKTIDVMSYLKKANKFKQKDQKELQFNEFITNSANEIVENDLSWMDEVLNINEDDKYID